MLEDYVSDLIRKAIELQNKKIEEACKEYCILNSIDVNDFIRKATLVHRRGLKYDTILVQHDNKNIMSFKCDRYGGVTRQDIGDSIDGTICECDRAQELIDWIGKNKFKINITDIWYDYVFCDDLIAKIKELFEI